MKFDLEEAKRLAGDGFWYLATVYSKFPDGIEAAFVEAARVAARLVKAGLRVYSPIAHTHPIAVHGNMDPMDHPCWLSLDGAFMRAAVGIIVVKMPGWEISVGIDHELKEFDRMGKPCRFLDWPLQGELK